MARAVVAGGLGLAVALGVAVAAWPEPRPPTPVARIAARVPAGAALPAVSAPVAAVPAAVPPVPASLQGTDVPDGLGEDAHGRLRVSRGLRDVFDHVLSTTGEEPATAQRARLQALAGAGLRRPAAAQALALYDRYVAYKDALDAHLRATRATSLADLRARLDTLRAERARHFTPEVVRAFFGDDDARDAHQLERLAVLQDARLAPGEKARRLADLRAAAPAALREAQDVVEVVETLDTLTADLRQRSGTPADLRQLRETLVGAEAADRLEALDRRTAAWNHRVAAYLQQRAALLGDPSVAEATRRAQVDALRREAFGPAERLRIETIERLQDAGARDAHADPARHTAG